MDQILWIGLCSLLEVAFVVSNETQLEMARTYASENFCHSVVIAHRGASGYIPEHTLASYALAVFMGADYIEPDLVMTADGRLIARHDNELGLTTDIFLHSEFASRFRNKTVDGKEKSGWFTEDFTLAEIKTLRAVERISEIRPGNARMDGDFEIPTFKEIIELVQTLQLSQRRTIGLCLEIKHSTYFQSVGLPMEQLIVDILQGYGYEGPQAPVYIQSFEVNNLKNLSRITQLHLLQLFGSKSKSPFDQIYSGKNVTYGDMATSNGLKEVAEYAHAVGPDKSYIIPRSAQNNLGTATSFVGDAHAVGLKVYPYTFRAENNFLPKEHYSVASPNKPSARGNLVAEIKSYLATGIDGLFCDQPDIPVRIRTPCSKDSAP